MISSDCADPTFAAYRARRDEASLRAVMQEHLPALRLTVRRVLSRRDLAEDAIQEAFVQLSRKHDTVRGPLAPWLRRVALNAALNLLRVESAQRRNGRIYEEVRLSADSPEELDPEVRSVVSGAIARLPDQHRSVIARGFFLGQSQSEIAAEDGISQVAVHKRMRAALAALRWEILKSGLGDCLGAFGQRQPAEQNQHCVLPVDPLSLSVMALFCLPQLVERAGQAGVCAGLAAAAWTEVQQPGWTPSRS